jgi:hypothetical protein
MTVSGAWEARVAASALAAMLAFATQARAEDPIVGTWVGQVNQQDAEPFETRLTFVSPSGGVSRYPSYPCGGMLAGGRKGDSYEYQETINWGGMDENPAGCISGVVNLSVKGDTMQFNWTTTYNGQNYHATGELHRQK